MPAIIFGTLLLLAYGVIRSWAKSDHAQKHSGFVFILLAIAVIALAIMLWPLVLFILVCIGLISVLSKA